MIDEVVSIGAAELEVSDPCDCMEICEDNQKLLLFKQKSFIEDDKEYSNLVDQYENLCQFGTQLKEGALKCLSRDKIKSLKVNFEKRKVSVDGLSNGFYFIRKETHAMVSGIRYERVQLFEEIEKRIKDGWEEEGIIIESANIPCINIYKRGFKN